MEKSTEKYSDCAQNHTFSDLFRIVFKIYCTYNFYISIKEIIERNWLL